MIAKVLVFARSVSRSVFTGTDVVGPDALTGALKAARG